MEDMSSGKRVSCVSCRALKMKCNSSPFGCQRCRKHGRLCKYEKKFEIKFCDQTNTAARIATERWRARSQQRNGNETGPRKWLVCQKVFSSLEDQAYDRFLYDFVGHRLLFQADLGSFISGSRHRSSQKSAPGPSYALTAVSLANFHRRHYSERAAKLAPIFLGKALLELSQELSMVKYPISFELGLICVLLALYQNLTHHESQVIGSWIHHFRGSINLISNYADHTGEVRQIEHLLMKQALAISSRMNLSIRPPFELRSTADLSDQYEKRAMALGFEVSEFNAVLISTDLGETQLSSCKLYQQIDSLRQEFDALERDLLHGLPFTIVDACDEAYPEWYQSIARLPGNPDKRASYPGSRAASIWNLYRVGRLKSCTHSPGSDESVHPNEGLERIRDDSPQRRSSIATSISLIDDICATVFSILSRESDGESMPTRIEDVRGSTAYTLMSNLHIVREWLIAHTSHAWPDIEARLDWIEKLLIFFDEKLGISEASCWKNGDEEQTKSLIQEQLSWKTT